MLCPHCQQPSEWEENPFRPFCSERCKLLDLGVWLGEGYRIPGQSFMVEGVVPEGLDEHEEESED